MRRRTLMLAGCASSRSIPGWVGGAELPPDDPPDGLHHNRLIAYDGTEKPAFSVAQQLFAAPPSFMH